MKRKAISAILILAGLAIMLFPKSQELYNDYKQKKLIHEWQKSLSILDKDTLGSEDGTYNESYDDFKSEQNQQKKTATEEKQKAEKMKKAYDDYIKKNMEGILIIDKINLKLPVLKGAKEKNMEVTVASMEHTGEAGKEGNYVIVGHRSRTYGRNFNRLNEVEPEDIIKIDVGEEIYTYIVKNKLYVLPEEVWVLEGNRNKKEITLITCHPMGNPTHRLIIKGEIIE